MGLRKSLGFLTKDILLDVLVSNLFRFGATNAAGTVYPTNLRQVTVKALTHQQCSNQYGGNSIVQNSMLCAGARGKDSCFGGECDVDFWCMLTVIDLLADYSTCTHGYVFSPFLLLDPASRFWGTAHIGD